MTDGKVTVLRAVKTPAKQAAVEARAAFGPGDALQALSTITDAVVEHGRVREENQTAREAIRERASAMRERIVANRQTLDRYIDRAFDSRDLVLTGFLDGLDKAIAAGNVELASSMADRIADVVKSGPLVDAAKAQQQEPSEPIFRIGKSEKS